MKTTYRVLAYLVAVGVVVQAAAIAYAVFGEGAYVLGGGVVDKAMIENQSADFAGAGGFALHGINGQMVIPVVAVLLLIASFFARIPKGVLWAGIVVLAVALQVVLGLVSHSVPGLGMLHGINALIVLGTALVAARLGLGGERLGRRARAAERADVG